MRGEYVRQIGKDKEEKEEGRERAEGRDGNMFTVGMKLENGRKGERREGSHPRKEGDKETKLKERWTDTKIEGDQNLNEKMQHN